MLNMPIPTPGSLPLLRDLGLGQAHLRADQLGDLLGELVDEGPEGLIPPVLRAEQSCSDLPKPAPGPPADLPPRGAGSRPCERCGDPAALVGARP